MKTLVLLLFVLATVSNCAPFIGVRPTATPNGNPDWLNQVIANEQSSPSRSSVDAIYRYEYKGQTVYLFEAPCCDQFNQLYDAGGNALCYPSGGITGKGDGKCPDFIQESKNGQLIWSKSH